MATDLEYCVFCSQHKVGFNNTNSGMPPSPGPPPGMYGSSSSPGMGPPHHHPMGPPVPGSHHHMGPGMGHPMANMMPPHGNSHHEGPMPPPSSTPNSHSLPTPSIQCEAGMDGMHDSGGLTTSASGKCMIRFPPAIVCGSCDRTYRLLFFLCCSACAGNMTNVSQMNSGGITSVITTGPDGAPMDEASQQSTLSNTSAGEISLMTLYRSHLDIIVDNRVCSNGLFRRF